MKTRIFSREEIRDLEKRLAYTRFDIHQRYPAVREIIAELAKILENSEDRSEYKFLYRQLGIYFAFYERDKKKSAEFFKRYLSFCHDPVEKAEALSLLAYAYTIDPNEKNHKLFSSVIEELADESDDITVNIIKGFAWQHCALMLHRQATRDKSREIETALSYIKKAIALHEKLLERFPLIKIDLAASWYINAVMLARMAKVHASEIYFAEADAMFQKAMDLASSFCQETGARHYLLSFIKQSHAMLSKNDDIAFTLLHEALTEQREMSQHPIDIAKSLHLIGDYHARKKNYVLAVEYYLESLICKMKIEYDDNGMIFVTQNHLLAALNSSPVMENKNLGLELRKKILGAILVKDQDFVNPCDDFSQLIECEMNDLKKECMDDISLKYLGTQNTLFGAIKAENKTHDQAKTPEKPRYSPM